jgi:hypothetical protein
MSFIAYSGGSWPGIQPGDYARDFCGRAYMWERSPFAVGPPPAVLRPPRLAPQLGQLLLIVCGEWITPDVVSEWQPEEEPICGRAADGCGVVERLEDPGSQQPLMRRAPAGVSWPE